MYSQDCPIYLLLVSLATITYLSPILIHQEKDTEWLSCFLGSQLLHLVCNCTFHNECQSASVCHGLSPSVCLGFLSGTFIYVHGLLAHFCIFVDDTLVLSLQELNKTKGSPASSATEVPLKLSFLIQPCIYHQRSVDFVYRVELQFESIVFLMVS
jgi:hypothetical protein